MARPLTPESVLLVLGASTAAGRWFLDAISYRPGIHVLAVSRRPPDAHREGVTWLQHDLDDGPAPARPSVLVSFGPVGLAVRQLQSGDGIGRVVAVSSASTEFKTDSPDPLERSLMRRIRHEEARLFDLCRDRDVLATLLKTTMIYGGGEDANVRRLANLMRRLPLVPVTGRGLRAPVHAQDLADLAARVLSLGPVSQGAWLLGGGERLSYPAMLRRIADAEGIPARLLPLPAWSLRPVLGAAHLLGKLRDVTPAMLARQAEDLVVDDAPARAQLGWNPRPFSP